MADIIDGTDLASYLAGDTELILTLANELVSDLIGDATVTARIRAITLEVAARASRNSDGLTSVTTSIDDWSKTKRYETAEKLGVFISAAERAELLGLANTGDGAKRYGSIRLNVPGYGR